MEFRSATLRDLEKIATLFHACWQISYAELLKEDVRSAMTLTSAMELWKPALINPNGKDTVMGFSDSSLVSVFRIGPDPVTSDRGHLFSLYVDPSSSGNGFGKKSLAEAIARLKGLGYREISLWVFAANERARALYESSGFEVTGVTRIDERWREQEIEMLKVIN